MKPFTIQPLLTGTIIVDKGMYLTRGSGIGLDVAIPSIAWYLTDGDRHILIDTGMCATARADWHHKGSRQEPGQAVHEALAESGVRTDQIDTILFTHLHWDHCQNIDAFPRARLVVSEQELDFARSPNPLYYKSYEHARCGLTPSFVGRSFDTVDGDTEVVPGIRMFPTPGHCPGHYSAAVATDAGTTVVAGDAVFAYVNLVPASELLPYTIMGRVTDVIAAWTSIEEVVRRADVVLPGHDFAVFDVGGTGKR